MPALLAVIVVDFRRGQRGARLPLAAVALAVVHFACWLPEESSLLRTVNLVVGVPLIIAAALMVWSRVQNRGPSPRP